MYLNAMIGLLAAGSIRRMAGHRAAGSPGKQAPACFAGLSDHQLRDLGYPPERSVPFRHLMWM